MKIPVRISDMPSSGEYGMPKEGDVLQWFVQAGDRIHQGEDLFEFETDKATVVMPAPISGILVDIAYTPNARKTWIRGEVIDIKDGRSVYDPPFCWIETEVEQATEVVVLQKKQKPKIPLDIYRLMQQYAISIDDVLLRFPNTLVFGEKEIHAVISEKCIAMEQSHLPAAREHILYKPEVSDFVIPSVSPSHGLSAYHAAVPAARARARDLGIDLSVIQGSGPDGLILVQDVEQSVIDVSLPVVNVSQPMASQQLSRKLPDEGPILLEMSRLLRTIAENMEEASHIPTVDTRPTAITFDFTPLIVFYQRFHARFAYALWFPVMLATARVLGREEFIVFNSFFVQQDGEHDTSLHPSLFVAARKRVHMGIAYDRGEAPVINWENKTISGEALRILVIRDANIKPIAELIHDVQRLLRSALKKRFELTDVSGYTFIFNNVGAIGHHSGRSLLGKHIGCQLNLGLVDISVGTGVLQVVFDHRLINGARSAVFARAIHEEMVTHVLPELELYLS